MATDLSITLFGRWLRRLRQVIESGHTFLYIYIYMSTAVNGAPRAKRVADFPRKVAEGFPRMRKTSRKLHCEIWVADLPHKVAEAYACWRKTASKAHSAFLRC